MKRALKVNVAVTVLCLLCVVFSPCYGSERDWPTTVLDFEGDVGQHIDMQIDSNGHLHIIYLRADTGVIKVISQDAGGWTTPVEVDGNGSAVGYCALATTDDGQLPVSYKRDDSASLFFAGPQIGKVWSVSPITTEADDVGRHLSAETSEPGVIALAFRNETDTTLNHLCREAGTWTAIESVDTEPGRSEHIDLAYRPGIGYAFSVYNPQGGYLALADPVIEAPQWAISQITDLEDDVGKHLAGISAGGTDLALSFRNETAQSLLHMRRESGIWSAVDTVDASPGRGLYNDLALRPGGGYAFSAYADDDGYLTFADPEIEEPQWAISSITEMADDLGRHLVALSAGGTDLALSFRNETTSTLQHIRRESGIWTDLETVDPTAGRGLYNDMANRPGGGYSFSGYAEDHGYLTFADPEIQGQDWFIRTVDHHVDVGHQISMVKGPEGHLDYTYLGFDLNHDWHVRAGEFEPDPVRMLSAIDDSVATSSAGHVCPDLYVSPGQNWAVSYRNDIDGYLYLARTEGWQIEAQSVSNPEFDDDGLTAAPDLRLGAVSNPVTDRVRVRFAAPAAAPVQLHIFDAAGRLVNTRESHCQRGANVIDCDLRGGPGSELTGGVYFLNLQVGETDLGTKRFILVR